MPMGCVHSNRLFMCQDEDEFFRSFRIKTVTNEPGPQYYDTWKDRFVRHTQVPERTKALVFVFVFVFVLAHEQAINKLMKTHDIIECEEGKRVKLLQTFISTCVSHSPLRSRGEQPCLL